MGLNAYWNFEIKFILFHNESVSEQLCLIWVFAVCILQKGPFSLDYADMVLWCTALGLSQLKPRKYPILSEHFYFKKTKLGFKLYFMFDITQKIKVFEV